MSRERPRRHIPPIDYTEEREENDEKCMEHSDSYPSESDSLSCSSSSSDSDSDYKEEERSTTPKPHPKLKPNPGVSTLKESR